jgi:hypothetical protein
VIVANTQPPIKALDQLTDAELRQHEIVVPRKSRRGAAFVPSFPVRILGAVVTARAEKALPVVLAIHRQLLMTRREWTPLNSAIWIAAGSPTDKGRATILRKLKHLPDLIRIKERRTPLSRYRVARGPLWANDPYQSDDVRNS